MKITSVLPEKTNMADALLIAEIHSGVIIGWKNLPVDIQKIVTWVCIEFTKPPMEKFAEITIKIKPSERELSTSFFHVNDFFPAEVKELISTQFRRTVLGLIEEEIANSKSVTKALQKLTT